MEYDKKIQQCKDDNVQCEKDIEKSLKERQGGDGDREKMIKELDELKKLKEDLTVELKQFERSDPKILDKISKDTKISKEAINRWTDNLY